MAGYIYIMSNKPQGTLYIGVTSDLPRRAYEHREELVKGFTSRYGLHLLVYYETFDDIRDAIQREKTLKHWPRAWKLALIHEQNPDWKIFICVSMNKKGSLTRAERHARL